MKQIAIFNLLFFLTPFIFSFNAVADTKHDVEFLPDITLTIPQKKEHIQYLGLKGEPGTPFKLSDIDADILIIELLNRYCPHCRKAAPTVNELFKKMEKSTRPDLKLVIIGIGANNTDLEVKNFSQKFNIAFPLFPDSDLAIYKILNGAGTPTFVACKKEGDKYVIFLRRSGSFTDPAEFLDNLLNLSGLR